MSLNEATPTADELRALDFAELTAAATRRTSWAYAMELLHPRRVPEQGAASWAAHVLASFALSLRLDPDDDADPLKFSTWFRELGPDALSTTQLDALAEWLPHVTDPEIEARVSDLLWIARRPRDHRDGRAAVDAYCRTATILVAPGQDWPAAVQRFQRAIVLARKFQKPREIDTVERAIEDVLDDRSLSSEGPRNARLMQLMLDHGLGDAAKYGAEAESSAEKAEVSAAAQPWGTNMGYVFAREFWTAAAGWREREHAPDSDEVGQLRRRAAETYALEAEKAREAGQRLVEASFLSDAITALRRCGGPSARIESLMALMMTAQREAPRAGVESSIDLTEQAAAGRRAVAGRPFGEALHRLAFIVQTPRLSTLREMALDYSSRSPIPRLMAASLTSSDHRVVKHLPALDSEDGVEEATLRWRMWDEARWLRLQACGHVHGARLRLLEDHQPRLADLAPIVSASWLVPPGHEKTFARGLRAGLFGDFVSATHILIPQLENGLRRFVEEEIGKPMISHRDDGTQMARMLDRILVVPELAKLLGEDLIFDLQGLLVRQEASNLRNRVAHGLLGDRDLGIDGEYLWWRVLQLAIGLIPTRTTPGAESDGAATDASVPSEAARADSAADGENG